MSARPVRTDSAASSYELARSARARRTDTVVKHGEYADAGIGHYWMVNLLDGPSLTACHLAGKLGYADEAPVRGTFTTGHPFPVRLDLEQLG